MKDSDFPSLNKKVQKVNPSFEQTNPSSEQTNPSSEQTNPSSEQTNPSFEQTVQVPKSSWASILIQAPDPSNNINKPICKSVSAKPTNVKLKHTQTITVSNDEFEADVINTSDDNDEFNKYKSKLNLTQVNAQHKKDKKDKKVSKVDVEGWCTILGNGNCNLTSDEYIKKIQEKIKMKEEKEKFLLEEIQKYVKTV